MNKERLSRALSVALAFKVAQSNALTGNENPFAPLPNLTTIEGETPLTIPSDEPSIAKEKADRKPDSKEDNYLSEPVLLHHLGPNDIYVRGMIKGIERPFIWLSDRQFQEIFRARINLGSSCIALGEPPSLLCTTEGALTSDGQALKRINALHLNRIILGRSLASQMLVEELFNFSGITQ